MIEIFRDYKDKNRWVIRNGVQKVGCFVDDLSKQNLLTIHRKIGKILKIPNWKVEMEKDKKKFIS